MYRNFINLCYFFIRIFNILMKCHLNNFNYISFIEINACIVLL